MIRGSVPKPMPGERLSAEWCGVVTDFINNPAFPPMYGNSGGIYDAMGGAFYQPQKHKPCVQVYAPSWNLPRNSVGILGGDPNNAHVMPADDGSNPYWGMLRQDGFSIPGYTYDTVNLHRILVTNESADIPILGHGWATIIGNVPVPVLADPYYPPVPFHPCGPEAGKTEVSCRSAGLLAVSNVNDNGLVWVIAHTPRFFFAKTSGLLLPPDVLEFPHSTTANVYFPVPPTESASWPDELEMSQDPAFLGLEVYTHDTTLEVPNDTFIHITFEWGRWYIIWTAC